MDFFWSNIFLAYTNHFASLQIQTFYNSEHSRSQKYDVNKVERINAFNSKDLKRLMSDNNQHEEHYNFLFAV